MKSIRHHLLVWQTGALLIAVIVASILTYMTVWHSFNIILDRELRQIAVSIAQHSSGEQPASSDLAGPDETGVVLNQIWDDTAHLQYSSLPEEKLPLTASGFSNLDWNGHYWRIYVMQHKSHTIQVAHRLREREIIFQNTVMWAVLLPSIALVIMLTLILWFVVVRALAPLDAVRTAIARRSAQDLTAISTEPIPGEISSLVDTLNQLLRRINDMLQTQRRFIADAAHELRTPLTAIKLQAQLAERAESMPQCQNSLKHLEEAVARSAHLVDQLLQMAKLEPDAQLFAPRPLPLDQLVKQSVVSFSLLAAQKQLDLGVKQAQPACIIGHQQAIQALINNLLDNAIHYTPPSGVIDVSVLQQNHQIILQVADSGPGIPEAERQRVFERFHRLAGNDTRGSGLGLAIVDEVVRMHGARIELATAELGGLLVSVYFSSSTTPCTEQDK